jgi:hypothetical protein
MTVRILHQILAWRSRHLMLRHVPALDARRHNYPLGEPVNKINEKTENY